MYNWVPWYCEAWYEMPLHKAWWPLLQNIKIFLIYKMHPISWQKQFPANESKANFCVDWFNVCSPGFTHNKSNYNVQTEKAIHICVINQSQVFMHSRSNMAYIPDWVTKNSFLQKQNYSKQSLKTTEDFVTLIPGLISESLYYCVCIIAATPSWLPILFSIRDRGMKIFIA